MWGKTEASTLSVSLKPFVIGSWVSVTTLSDPSNRLVASRRSSWPRVSVSTTSCCWLRASEEEEAGSEVTVWMMTPSLEQRLSAWRWKACEKTHTHTHVYPQQGNKLTDRLWRIMCSWDEGEELVVRVTVLLLAKLNGRPWLGVVWR